MSCFILFLLFCVLLIVFIFILFSLFLYYPPVRNDSTRLTPTPPIQSWRVEFAGSLQHCVGGVGAGREDPFRTALKVLNASVSAAVVAVIVVASR